MFQNVLFDFDGTLVNSGPSIFEGLRYTFNAVGLAIPSDDVLGEFIGPSIEMGFKKFGKIEDEKLIKKMSSIYRDVFTKDTYKKCELYDGILEMLKTIRTLKDGIGNNVYKVYVASSRMNESLFQLIEYLHIEEFFDGIYGSDEEIAKFRNETKKRVIEKLLKNERIDNLNSALMVGDRMYDVEGAHNVGLKACGILWGYGTKEEFVNCKAEYTIEKPNDIFTLI